jgi:hypothetical protein
MKTGKGEIIFPLKHPSSVRLWVCIKTLLISGFITLIFLPWFNYDCINRYHHDSVMGTVGNLNWQEFLCPIVILVSIGFLKD